MITPSEPRPTRRFQAPRSTIPATAARSPFSGRSILAFQQFVAFPFVFLIGLARRLGALFRGTLRLILTFELAILLNGLVKLPIRAAAIERDCECDKRRANQAM